jgi:hypothetical protein
MKQRDQNQLSTAGVLAMLEVREHGTKNGGKRCGRIAPPLPYRNAKTKRKRDQSACASQFLQDRPNKGMELTASSVRSCLAPASGSSSCLALGLYRHRRERI